MGILLRNKAIVIGVVVVIVGVVWYLMSSGSDSSSSVITSDNTVSVQDQALVESLLALRAISLSGAVLTNPAFGTLKDDSTQIVAEPVGRDDPFQPLTSSAVPTSTTTQGAQIFKSRQN